MLEVPTLAEVAGHLFEGPTTLAAPPAQLLVWGNGSHCTCSGIVLIIPRQVHSELDNAYRVTITRGMTDDLESMRAELASLKAKHKAAREYARRKIYEAASDEERLGAAGAHDAIVKASVASRVLQILSTDQETK